MMEGSNAPYKRFDNGKENSSVKPIVPSGISGKWGKNKAGVAGYHEGGLDTQAGPSSQDENGHASKKPHDEVVEDPNYDDPYGEAVYDYDYSNVYRDKIVNQVNEQKEEQERKELAEEARVAEEEKKRLEAEERVESSVSEKGGTGGKDAHGWVALTEEVASNGDVHYKNGNQILLTRHKESDGFAFKFAPDTPAGVETKIENAWTHDGKPAKEELILDHTGKIIGYSIEPEGTKSKCSEKWLQEHGIEDIRSKNNAVKTAFSMRQSLAEVSKMEGANNVGAPSPTPTKGPNGKRELSTTK